jgi:hypothetical protein
MDSNLWIRFDAEDFDAIKAGAAIKGDLLDRRNGALVQIAVTRDAKYTRAEVVKGTAVHAGIKRNAQCKTADELNLFVTDVLAKTLA